MAAALAVKLAVLFGVVTIGPTGPLCEVASPCDRPASEARLTFTRPGHVYTTRTTDAGAYRIKLPPGYYVVRANTGITLRPRNIHVRVPTTKLSFAIDTGIR
jgi:hypothetical protein